MFQQYITQVQRRDKVDKNTDTKWNIFPSFLSTNSGNDDTGN